MGLKKYRKGSLTVEASAVVPFVLLILFLTIYLCYYVHNRSFLISAASESALCGSMDGRQSSDIMFEKAHVRSQELSQNGLWGKLGIVSDTKVQDRVRVRYQMESYGQIFGFPPPLRLEASSEIFHPTERIREEFVRAQ